MEFHYLSVILQIMENEKGSWSGNILEDGSSPQDEILHFSQIH